MKKKILLILNIVLIVISCGKKQEIPAKEKTQPAKETKIKSNNKIKVNDKGVSQDLSTREIIITWGEIKSILPIHIKIGSHRFDNDLGHEYVEDITKTKLKVKVPSRPYNNENTYYITIFYYIDDIWKTYDYKHVLDGNDAGLSKPRYAQCNFILKPIIYQSDDGKDSSIYPSEEEFNHILNQVNTVFKTSKIKFSLESPKFIKDTAIMLGDFGENPSNKNSFNIEDFIKLIEYHHFKNILIGSDIDIKNYSNINIGALSEIISKSDIKNNIIYMLFFKHPTDKSDTFPVGKKFIVFKSYEKNNNLINSYDISKSLAYLFGLKERSLQIEHGQLPMSFDLKNTPGIMNDFNDSKNSKIKALKSKTAFIRKEIINMRKHLDDSSLFKKCK